MCCGNVVVAGAARRAPEPRAARPLRLRRSPCSLTLAATATNAVNETDRAAITAPPQASRWRASAPGIGGRKGRAPLKQLAGSRGACLRMGSIIGDTAMSHVSVPGSMPSCAGARTFVGQRPRSRGRVALARVRPRHRRQHGASSRHAIPRPDRTVASTMSTTDASRPPDGVDDANAPVPARNFRQDAPRFRRRPSPAPASDPDPRAIARAHPAVHVPARFRRRFRGRCRRVRRSRRRRLAVSGCARSATLDLTVVTAPLLRQVPGHLRSAPDASVPAGVVAAARFRERNRPERRRVRRGS